MQTMPTWDWARGTPTTQHQVCTASRNKEQRIPQIAFEADIRQQFRAVILQLGVWELNMYERDRSTQLPHQIKIAVLMKTKWPQQQHLHLMAGATRIYTDIRAFTVEYYNDKTTTGFSRLQQGTSSSFATNFNGRAAAMDIGATRKGKWRGKHKGKGKGTVKERKALKENAMDNKAMATEDMAKDKDQSDKQCPTRIQQLRIRKWTRTGNRQRQVVHNRLLEMWPVCNIQDDSQENCNDATEQWYGAQTTYDNHWWNDDQTHKLALPAPSQLDAPPALQIAAVTAPRNRSSTVIAPDMSMITSKMSSWSAVRQHMFAQLFQQHKRMTYQNKETKPENSSRRSHWSLWVRVGPHDQRGDLSFNATVNLVLGFVLQFVLSMLCMYCI